MREKTKVYYFYNGKGGGVLSVICNLLAYANHRNIESYVIHTICIEENNAYQPVDIPGAAGVAVFHYSNKWNFYTTCKRLSRLLPNEQVIVVANDWLELGMLSMLGLKNKVVQILHGDYEYYYQLAVNHQHIVDKFVAVSNSIKENLSKAMPDRLDDVSYLRFPVPEVSRGSAPEKKNCSIAFLGRCTHAKGYYLLPEIDNLLYQKGVTAEWHIVGAKENADAEKWRSDATVKFYGYIANKDIPDVLSSLNYFVLPSLAEGMPVALIEAMQCGLIPVVNCLVGGVAELVVDGQTGFLIVENEVPKYAEAFIYLMNHAAVAEQMRLNATARVKAMFNPHVNTRQYEKIYESLNSSSTLEKKAKKTFGSRLDNRWIPNLLTTCWRRGVRISL